MRWFSIMVVLSAVLGIGCKPPMEESGPELVVTASDDASGVRVQASVERIRIRTVDRARVSLRLTRPVGLAVEVSEPEWDDSGWELVSSEGPVRSAEDGIEGSLIIEEWHWTIEPFLDGVYTVPAFAVGVGDRLISTPPMGVEVVSVLATDDDGSMPEAAGTMLPQPERATTTAILAVCVVVGLGCVALGWWLRRDRVCGIDSALSDPEVLRAVAEGRIEGDAAMAALNGVLNRLEDGPKTADLLRRCESARFGASHQGEDPRLMAREALAVLGDMA